MYTEGMCEDGVLGRSIAAYSYYLRFSLSLSVDDGRCRPREGPGDIADFIAVAALTRCSSSLDLKMASERESGPYKAPVDDPTGELREMQPWGEGAGGGCSYVEFFFPKGSTLIRSSILSPPGYFKRIKDYNDFGDIKDKKEQLDFARRKNQRSNTTFPTLPLCLYVTFG